MDSTERKALFLKATEEKAMEKDQWARDSKGLPVMLLSDFEETVNLLAVEWAIREHFKLGVHDQLPELGSLTPEDYRAINALVNS